MLTTPVLLIAFNRPEQTAQVFERIRAVQPRHLYIAADGPRANVPTDAARCATVRKIISNIDWPCECRTYFRETNAGCGRGPSDAISWFLENEEAGIILEDDCLPEPGFFPYCAELLEHFRNDERIMHIGGNNSQFNRKHGQGSYYFSKYPHIWGWATWRSAWAHFRFEISVEELSASLPRIFAAYHFSAAERDYWSARFERAAHDGTDAWDFQWTYACWKHGGITVVPNANLISNIGFDSNATHTRSPDSRLANQPLQRITRIEHNAHVVVDDRADAATFDAYNLLNHGRWDRLLRRLKVAGRLGPVRRLLKRMRRA